MTKTITITNDDNNDNNNNNIDKKKVMNKIFKQNPLTNKKPIIMEKQYI